MIEYNADGATSAPVIEGEKLPKNVRKRKNGSIRKVCQTNSVIFKIEIIKNSNIWFDNSFQLMTGEDIDFFYRASSNGYKFVWCNKILLYETISDERKTLEWKIDRAINNGYLKIFNEKKYGKNITKKYYKILIDLIFFSFITILISPINLTYKNKCILKLMDCFGKIQSIFSNKTYVHYKRQ